MFQVGFMGVLRMFHSSFKVFLVCLRVVSRSFKGSFYDVQMFLKEKLILPLRAYGFCGSEGGGASEAPPKKSMMEWAETPCCYMNIVKM